MKFKFIFALFNAIIVLAFLFVFFMPLFVIDAKSTLEFWGKNWYVVVLFLSVLGILDGYFIKNWKVFSLLEHEDWVGLSKHLKTKIVDKHRFSDQNIRMLCNALVILGRTTEIRDVERSIREHKPKVLSHYVVLLCLPYLIEQDGKGLAAFCQPLLLAKHLRDEKWVHFFYAFGLMSNGDAESSRQSLVDLAFQKKDVLVQLASLYLLGSQNAVPDPAITVPLSLFRKENNANVIKHRIEQAKELLHVVLLSRVLLEPACEWAFSQTSDNGLKIEAKVDQQTERKE